MRGSLTFCSLSVFALCLPARSSAEAAVIRGRAVDSAGHPIAGAEVRIWQKLPGGDGRAENRAVIFDGDDVLVTDDEGRFTSPEVLVEEAFTRVVAEADGTLAVRSGWIEVGDRPTDAGEIVLKRLRTVVGRVTDRQMRPVADATVFDSGDGHRRVETKTDDTGNFRLPGVPEGDLFLFAEKPGFRFTGLHVSATDEAAFTLATVDEPVEPIGTLLPLVCDEEERGLARRATDAWLDEAAQAGTDAYEPLAALAKIDPVEACNRAGTMQFSNDRQRSRAQSAVVGNCIKRRALAWDELRTLIESTPGSKSGMYLAAVRQMDDSDVARRREWVAEALVCARRIEQPAARAAAFLEAAQGLFDAGDRERAAEIESEAETIVQKLPYSEASRFAFFWFARTLAKRDPDRALAWLEKIKDHNYVHDGAVIAVRLLPEHPDAAAEVWKRTGDRLERERPVQLASRSGQMADFCYRMAIADPKRAERIAREEKVPPLRVRGLAAAALRLAQSDPAAARKLLREIVRDELPRAAMDDDFEPFGFLLSAPILAAWVLPIAEQVDPQLGRECLWRSLSLRAPRPRRDKLDDEDAALDIELAMMLGRYDRDVARSLLAPQVAHLAELTRCASAGGNSQHARAAFAQASSETSKILAAALYIDPRWSAELFEGLPKGETESQRRFHAWIRSDWVGILSRRDEERRGEAHGFSLFSSNYWMPE